MSELLPIDVSASSPAPIEPFDWLGRVLTQFAIAEQALGQLCIELELPIEKGALSSLQQLCTRLSGISNKRSQNLLKRIEKWQSFRRQRHLLAHASVIVVHDDAGHRFIVTRHLPLDRNDVTPDRLWTEDECRKLIKDATDNGRSIRDQIRNLMEDADLLANLKKPDPGSSLG